MDPAVAARLHNLYWSLGTVAFIVVGSVAVGLLARRITRWRGASLPTQRRAFWGYTLASPWILGFVIFVAGPALASLFYSVTDYKLGRDLSFTGLDNYRTLLAGLGAHGRRFMQAMSNSFYYAVVGVPLQIVAALGMAMLVARPLRGMSFFRLVFYMPVILAGGPAILLAWRYMLASNGGFVNVSLASFAEAFPPFSWLYRSFISSVESFNAFFAGLTRNDPVGPLMYTLPALVGAALCLALALGAFTAAKRSVARTALEIVAALLAFALLRLALIADPVDPALVTGVALLAWLALWRARGNARIWRWGMGGLLAIMVAAPVIALLDGSPVTPYLVTALLAGVPTAVALAGAPAGAALASGGVANGLYLLLRLAPAELGEGRLATLWHLVTQRSAVRDPGSLDYLRTGFAAHAPSPLWLLALLAALLAFAAFAAVRPPTRRAVLVGAGALFGLLAIGSFVDAVRYFQSFDVIATASGAVNHHFALFRQVTDQFPDATRVPLWLGSELWSKPSLILITMWSSGAAMLIFLAALKGVPPVFYEAAEVDGATPWQKFSRITLPMISPAMFYNVVIGMIAALQTFEAVYLIQNTQTEQSLASAAYFLFVRTFRQLEIGQGAAASWILAVIIVLLTVAQFRYSRWVHYE